MQTSVEPVKDVWPKFYIPRHEVSVYGKRVAYYRREGEKIGRTFLTDGTSFIFSEWHDDGEIEVSERVAKSYVNHAPETDGCVSCGAPVMPGTAGCKDCNEYALEAVGAPRCLTEKQVFVMSYLAVQSHSFRTYEGFIDSNVMAAIHRDSENLWDMLQKGLKR